MSHSQYTQQIVFRGRYIQVAQASLIHSSGMLVQKDIILHPGAVAILPVIDDEHICLLHNQRLAVGERLLEIPAGTLEPNEEPDAAAVRELAEETGYSAARWQKLNEFYPSPGCLSEKTHLYVAQELTTGDMQPELDEDLEPIIVPWSDALRWATDGTLRDAKTIIAILFWERKRSLT